MKVIYTTNFFDDLLIEMSAVTAAYKKAECPWNTFFLEKQIFADCVTGAIQIVG